MKTLKEIANDIINREADFIGHARAEYNDHPFFRQMSGVCVEVQRLEGIAETLYREPDLGDVEKAISQLESFQDNYSKRNVSDIIKELEEYVEENRGDN